MRTKMLCSVIMFGISFNSLQGQQREEVYVLAYRTLSYYTVPIEFIVIDNDLSFAYDVSFRIKFSRKGEIKGIKKFRADFSDHIKYSKLDNGNVFSEYGMNGSKKAFIGFEYYSTENFRETEVYEFLKKNQPELFDKDNYELLEYLENNYSKYYGPKDKNRPLLRKQE